MSNDPLSWIRDELDALEQRHLLRALSIRGGAQSARILLDGQQFANFGSNDYLGLAADPRLIEAAQDAIASSGFGSGASPLITGRGSWQAELERHLATFEDVQSTLVFPSGFAANVGVIAALAGRGDAIFSDAKNHASIIDGSRLSRAEIHVFRHRDADHLDNLLAAHRAGGRRFVVTDTLFSMDGDLAPLPELVEICNRHQAILIVDEAHATGVFGRHGRGVVEHFGLEDQVPIRIGTLSKSLGSAGGFVAGSSLLIQYLANRARSYVYSTAMPTANSAAALAALRIVRDEPQRRERLLAKAATLRGTLRDEGWNVGVGQGPIIPIYVGDAQRTMQLSHQLRQHGLLLPGIRPPTVPEGESLLRISLCYNHSDTQISQLTEALRY